MNIQLSEFQSYKRNHVWFWGGGVVVVVGEDSSKGSWLEQPLSLSTVIIILGVSVIAPLIKKAVLAFGDQFEILSPTD